MRIEEKTMELTKEVLEKMQSVYTETVSVHAETLKKRVVLLKAYRKGVDGAADHNPDLRKTHIQKDLEDLQHLLINLSDEDPKKEVLEAIRAKINNILVSINSILEETPVASDWSNNYLCHCYGFLYNLKDLVGAVSLYQTSFQKIQEILRNS
jgi:hypothetical protein